MPPSAVAIAVVAALLMNIRIPYDERLAARLGTPQHTINLRTIHNGDRVSATESKKISDMIC